LAPRQREAAARPPVTPATAACTHRVYRSSRCVVGPCMRRERTALAALRPPPVVASPAAGTRPSDPRQRRQRRGRHSPSPMWGSGWRRPPHTAPARHAPRVRPWGPPDALWSSAVEALRRPSVGRWRRDAPPAGVAVALGATPAVRAAVPDVVAHRLRTPRSDEAVGVLGVAPPPRATMWTWGWLAARGCGGGRPRSSTVSTSTRACRWFGWWGRGGGGARTPAPLPVSRVGGGWSGATSERGARPARVSLAPGVCVAARVGGRGGGGVEDDVTGGPVPCRAAGRGATRTVPRNGATP